MKRLIGIACAAWALVFAAPAHADQPECPEGQSVVDQGGEGDLHTCEGGRWHEGPPWRDMMVPSVQVPSGPTLPNGLPSDPVVLH